MLRVGRLDLAGPQQPNLDPPAADDATQADVLSPPVNQQHSTSALAKGTAIARPHSPSKPLRGRASRSRADSSAEPSSSEPAAPSQVLQAARAALRPTQSQGHAEAPVRVAVPTSPVSDELLTPGQFTQPSPVPPLDPSALPEPSPALPMPSNGTHADIMHQPGLQVHADGLDQPGADLTPVDVLEQPGASLPHAAAQGKQLWCEGLTPPPRAVSPLPDALSADEDAALSGPASLSLEDVPVRKQTIRMHGSSSRPHANPNQRHANGSSHAASEFHSFSDHHGSASRSGIPPPVRSPHNPQASSAPLRPSSLNRGTSPASPNMAPETSSSSSRKAPLPSGGAQQGHHSVASPRQHTPGSMSQPSDTPAGPEADIIGLLETGAPPPAAYYDNEHLFTIEPPSLDELDPEEQITPHDIPSPLKATSRQTLFLQQGLPVGEPRSSSKSLGLSGLPEDPTADTDLSEEKREQQQEHIRMQLQAFVQSSRQNSQRYLGQQQQQRGGVDPLATVTALQGSSTHSLQDVATSEGRQSPSPHHRSSPTQHCTSSNPPNLSGMPLGTSPTGSLPRTRSNSRPPSRSHSERRRRGEHPYSSSPLQPHARQEGGSAAVVQADSHRLGRGEGKEHGVPPEPEHVTAHVTANVQHPLQHATSAPQPVSPGSAPTDVVETVQELPAQVTTPLFPPFPPFHENLPKMLCQCVSGPPCFGPAFCSEVSQSQAEVLARNDS